MTEPWTSQPSVLFSKKTAKYFIPTQEMTYIEKINASTRFLIYGSILLFIIRGDTNVFFIPIVGMIVMYFLITKGIGMKQLEERFSKQKTESCQEPDINNPFMNILPMDDRKRPDACEYNATTKDKIDDSFYANLYLDTNDIYGKNNSQRQYYTMPSTSIPNAQDEFASWLYETTPSSKETQHW
jgi:hypothetical protein